MGAQTTRVYKVHQVQYRTVQYLRLPEFKRAAAAAEVYEVQWARIATATGMMSWTFIHRSEHRRYLLKEGCPVFLPNGTLKHSPGMKNELDFIIVYFIIFLSLAQDNLEGFPSLFLLDALMQASRWARTPTLLGCGRHLAALDAPPMAPRLRSIRSRHEGWGRSCNHN